MRLKTIPITIRPPRTNHLRENDEIGDLAGLVPEIVSCINIENERPHVSSLLRCGRFYRGTLTVMAG